MTAGWVCGALLLAVGRNVRANTGSFLMACEEVCSWADAWFCCSTHEGNDAMRKTLFWILGLLAVWGIGLCWVDCATEVKVKLSFEEPVHQYTPASYLYCNMPAWVRVEFVAEGEKAVPEDVRYPLREQPWYCGDHKFEVKKAEALPRIPLPEGQMMAGGIGPGSRSYSYAPPSVRRNWFPLHLWYRLDSPGDYFVQYSNKELGVWSDWEKIEVRPFSAKERHQWLEAKMSVPPGDAGRLVSEYIPSLLACPDRESLKLLLECAHHGHRFVDAYAVYGLLYYDDGLLREEILKLLAKKGPTYYLSHFLSWEKKKFEPISPGLVEVLAPFLKTGSSTQAREAVRSLSFVRSGYSLDDYPSLEERIEESVLENVNGLMEHEDVELLNALAVFMGIVKMDRAREVLWRLAERETSREQAFICLSWHGNRKDLPDLADFLVSGDESARSLPYHLRRQYSDEALPYLRKALRESPSVAIRLECARELALEGDKEAFKYLGEQFEADTQGRYRIVSFVLDHFKLLGDRSEEAVLEYVKARSQ